MLSVVPKVALPNTSLYSVSGFEPFDFSHFSPSFPVFMHYLDRLGPSIFD